MCWLASFSIFHFATDICNTASPSFRGLFRMMQDLLFAQRCGDSSTETESWFASLSARTISFLESWAGTRFFGLLHFELDLKPLRFLLVGAKRTTRHRWRASNSEQGRAPDHGSISILAVS
jgi:hypothetical protein